MGNKEVQENPRGRTLKRKGMKYYRQGNTEVPLLLEDSVKDGNPAILVIPPESN